MKYNETGIEVAFIENLLANTYIPDIPFGKLADEEDKEIDTCYLDKLHIYKDKGEILSEYQFGKSYPNLTSNFISNNSYYTPDLHEAFGRYIKFYDDFYNIPVKGMYNCFSNRWVDSCCKKDNYKTFLVPIKWFHTYSIYLQSGYTVYARPIFFNGTEEQKVDEPARGESSPITGLLNIADTAIFPTANIPEVYKVEDIFNSLTTDIGVNKNFLYSREDMLYLAISVHNDFTGKIVVLEDENSSVLNKELLSSSVQDSIPYSSKLLSYIMDRVITPISNPYYITQLQEKLKKIDPSLTFTKGIFSEEMRNFLANLFSIEVPQLYGETVSDLTGYVDREIEEWLDNNSEALKTAVKERDKIKEYNYQYKYFWEDGTEFTEEEYSRVVNPNPKIIKEASSLSICNVDKDDQTYYSIWYATDDGKQPEFTNPSVVVDITKEYTTENFPNHITIGINDGVVYITRHPDGFNQYFTDLTVSIYSSPQEEPIIFETPLRITNTLQTYKGKQGNVEVEVSAIINTSSQIEIHYSRGIYDIDISKIEMCTGYKWENTGIATQSLPSLYDKTSYINTIYGVFRSVLPHLSVEIEYLLDNQINIYSYQLQITDIVPDNIDEEYPDYTTDAVGVEISNLGYLIIRPVEHQVLLLTPWHNIPDIITQPINIKENIDLYYPGTTESFVTNICYSMYPKTNYIDFSSLTYDSFIQSGGFSSSDWKDGMNGVTVEVDLEGVEQ